MPAIHPRVLVTDERQRTMKSIEVLAIDRTTGATIARATTGLDGVARFGSMDENRELVFRPMSNRNSGRPDTWGAYRIQVLPQADNDAAPSIPFMNEDAGDVEPRVYLVFTTAPKQVEQDEETSNITIQRRDEADEPLTTGDLLVYLYSSSPDGIFRFDPPGGDPPVEVTTVTIEDGDSTVSFTYEDADAGNPVITASTEELT
jgi:hypothetical protein